MTLAATFLAASRHEWLLEACVSRGGVYAFLHLSCCRAEERGRVMRSRGVFVVLHFCWRAHERKTTAVIDGRHPRYHPPVRARHRHPLPPLGQARRSAPHVRPCQRARDPGGAQRSDLHRPSNWCAKSPAERPDTTGRISPAALDTGVARTKPPHPVPAHRHASDQAAAVRCARRSWITVLEGAERIPPWPGWER